MNEAIQERIKETIRELDTLALFHLSLASRELFHSNFWYWLSKTGTDGPRKLYRALTAEEDDDRLSSVTFHREVSRETRKSATADLVASLDGDTAILVVENKLKDIPRKEQLERLVTAFGPDDPRFLVVTPLPDEMLGYFRDDESLSAWIHLKYGDFAARIREQFLPNDNSYHDGLIREYIQLLTHLNDLSQQLFETTSRESYDFIKEQNPDLFETLDRVKLWELYQRIRGSHMARSIGDRLKNRGLDVNPVISINHKKATLDFKLHLENADNKKQSGIGIQIEGNQYRRILEMPKDCDEAAKMLLDQGTWFRWDGKKSPEKQLCKYGSTFRYQYEKLQVGPNSSSRTDLSYESLADRIANDMQRAPVDILRT